MTNWSNVNQKTQTPSHFRRRGGFTFIELLVVMSIILLLLGLLAAWFVKAVGNQGARSTQSAMASLLTAADILKNKSAVLPDHRLANYVWIQPHQTGGGTPLWAANPAARQMSSMEFFLFLAAMNPDTQKIIQSITDKHLKPSTIPDSWGTPPLTGFVVDVFMQYPGASGVFDKSLIGPPSRSLPAASYALMSGLDGLPLRSILDAWDHELIYRFSTDKVELNVADGTYPKAAPEVGSYMIMEKIVQDEQVAFDRYVRVGEPAAAGVEYVRPAVAAYPFPAFASPGKDGLWGAFKDVTDAGGTAEKIRDALDTDRDGSRDAKARDNIYSQEENR